MYTISHIDMWLKISPENQKLEFKEAKNNFSKDKLREYCVAIANEGGGHIVLGVSDAIPRKIVGSYAFTNILKTSDELFRSLGFRIDIPLVSEELALSFY
jgi:ATP-dependent DNA helicase RecG